MALLSVGLMVGLLLGGCAPPSGSNPPERIVAIVVAHHDTELPPALSDAEHVGLRVAALDGEAPPVLVIAAGRPDTERVDLTPRRPNGQLEHGPRRYVLVDQRLDALDVAIDREAASTSSTDLLGALGQAVRLGATEIHLLTSGLTAIDPFDMRVTGFDVDPPRLADGLARSGALPDATGRTIVLSGLGRTTGRQAPLDEAAQNSLRAQWLAVCGAMHASCRLDDTPRALRAAVPAPLPGPVVSVPRTRTTGTPGGGEEVSLPSAVLFLPDRCALRDPAAASQLVTDIADRLRAGSTATVSGRTAPVGPGDGVDLATCRARAVAGLLTAAGAPGAALTRVTGDGSADDPPGSSRDAAGRPDPTTYPALRRVVLTVTPPARP